MSDLETEFGGIDIYLFDQGGRLLDPLKTSLVQDQRCMTTWVVRKDTR